MRKSGFSLSFKTTLIWILSISFCPCLAIADPTKDELDLARHVYDYVVSKATADLTSAFDVQIKAISQTGNLDAVQQLRAQRTAFVSSTTIPTSAAMRSAVAQYQQTSMSAEAALRTAYENAVSDYTKAGKFDDAEMVRHAMNQRFISQQPAANVNGMGNASGPTTIPADGIMDNLKASKAEFVRTVLKAHLETLGVIDAKAKAAADNGNLDAYKQLAALSDKVKSEIVVPSNVKDTDIRIADAKFREKASAAYDKLQVDYQGAISALTKARRIEEAEVVQAELGEGGWFRAYVGRPEVIDLLQLIDVRRDTIRKGWVLKEGVLQPTRWDDDHGPFIKIPVSVRGSYELHVRFRLSVAPEALYLHVPVGNKWGLLALASARQDFANIQGRGDIHGFVTIPLDSDAEAVFRVSCNSDGSVGFILKVNDQESIVWKGNGQSVVNNGNVWGLQDQSWFAIDAKSATITGMELQASHYEIP
jgi:hypothetical protein